MLTISKPLSAAQAQNYHKKEFTSKEQSYWGRGEQIPGAWHGRLAGHYGLSDTVGEEEFARLSQGQHPLTGEQLVRHRASYQYERADGTTVTSATHRAGWDATFSAPKSVSLRRWSEAMNESGKRIVRVFAPPSTSLNAMLKPAWVAIIPPEQPVSLSLPPSSTTRPDPSTAMPH